MHGEIHFGGELIELSGLSLREVGDLDDSPLALELRELLIGAGSGHGLTAGFQSKI
ncbi:hypothetical protein GCM10027176_81340 [Actinoallomurus bryophytorum]|uniref:FXSXX-COOH protein n=1 Tax=Actinoallomurus bryophytorum TaxID=1490222 RepID=A0A543CI96_9ACTN|nr:hypothetical protein [Actinoallomurus bryophytorum]TQL96750.1 hypothetical protein FB559_2302 [Actinoallomurus bryophytorum]